MVSYGRHLVEQELIKASLRFCISMLAIREVIVAEGDSGSCSIAKPAYKG
jgi:hypothetical protein